MKKFFYRVQNGDGLLALSEKFSVPVGVLISLNNLTADLAQGDILYIERDERMHIYTVGVHETAEIVAKKFCTTPEKILNDNAVDYLFYGLKIYL